ncbi:hypothetical protein [uncultured Arthrobacter sp.]|uniref:hypothetical protein n=1 Tax=uncultured Arthrobacter sp. TaxID=114050 RepID=UPI0025CC27D4|nr:hypothetical protein [uncultured Arthrobacter sp.]
MSSTWNDDRMGPATRDASTGAPGERRASYTAADEVQFRVIGATFLQTIGMFLLFHVGQVGGSNTNMWLGLIYGAMYVAIGLSVLGIKSPSKAVAVFVLPGILLGLIGSTGGGYWAGLWVPAVTPWAFISLDAAGTPSSAPLLPRLLRLILGLAGAWLLLGAAIFWTNPWAYLLVFVPLPLLLLGHYSGRPWRAALDCTAGVALLVLLIALPEFWLSLEASFAGIAAIAGLALTWLTRSRG